MTLYGLTKECLENLSKKMKKSVDKVVSRWYYSQAVRRESDTENRITTAFEGFSGASAHEKTSKKSQKSS
ncbi:hypothetical protein H6B10_11725 [Gemmiger formicilis]|uniref:hypothetical protein n=1 Tax=Gemmiger formicilis TaxID=745368 RepID=UPI0019588300|nr:hypothetical protein [Gemmiger formicilis]MBM6900375.1 hypothetical protein [Gemmiger formicilis]